MTTLARKHQTALPYELWPSQRDDLSVPVKDFLDRVRESIARRLSDAAPLTQG